ncbi:MAG: thimet oligopeptidase [Chlamydiales bacterium]|jgi:thimet oligopeptidase
MNWERPQDVGDDVRARIGEARSALAEFLALDSKTAAREQLLAYDRIGHPLDLVAGRLSLTSSVHPDAAVREQAELLEQEFITFTTELSLHRGLFEQLSHVDASALTDDEDRRFLEHALRDFRLSGVDRDEATRARIRELQDVLVEVGQAFDRNIIEGARSIHVKDGHAGLEGLPQDYLDSHPEDADGGLTLTSDPADWLPFRLYAQRADLREQLSHAVSNRAYPENMGVLDRMLALRHELARLLGYSTWAEYITQDKMVRSANAARDFIQRAADLALPRARAEIADLLLEKRKLEPQASAVFDHDVAFLQERLRRTRFGFDSQEVRPYLAFEAVRAGVLSTSEALYGVEFARVEDAPVWHPSVECIELREGGSVVGRFYLDMFPRAGKNKHAFVCELRSARPGVLPEAALVCNFPEPGPGQPALLLHSQVTTFFHEFGHLLHHLFATRPRYLRFSGISTEWDFVEVPSQLYEEWAWNTEVLQRFARHHETGEPIPAELVQRMRAAEEYGKGMQVSTQAYYAMLSLSFHDAENGDPDTAARMLELRRAMVPVPHGEDSHFQASFGHLHGYSAIYYTYLWSLVISKDMFGRFEDDPMGAATARGYREAVLARGGSRDGSDLVTAFLGREYNFHAWEDWLKRGA